VGADPVASPSPRPSHQLSPHAAEFIPSRSLVGNYIQMLHDTQQLDFIYFNARSIKNKLAELYDVLYHKCFSIVCISESWLTADMSEGIIDPQSKYTIYRCDRKNRDGGGVCILVSNQLSSTVIESTRPTVFSGSYDLVGCRLHSTGQIHLSSDIVILCVYIPPDTTTDDFIQAMSDIKAMWDGDDCVGLIIGDFNEPDIDWRNVNRQYKSSKSQALYDMFTDIGCEQYVMEPTRGANILDLLFCNDPLFLSTVTVTPPFSTSDHATILFSTLIVYPADLNDGIDDNSESRCDWSRADWIALTYFFSNVDWNNEYSMCVNSNELITALLAKLYEGINLFVPIKSWVPTRNSRKKIVPNFVKKLQDKKLFSWQALKEDNSLSNAIAYKQSAAAVKLAYLKNDFCKEARILNSGDLGQFYKHVNGRLSHKDGIAPLKRPDGVIAFSDLDKAELLNSAFTKSRTIDNDVFPELKTRDPSIVLSSIAFEPLSVKSKLVKLKSRSSPGPDGIPAIFFKSLAHILALPLCLLFRLILQHGCLPDCWKLANVTPIFKKGPSSTPDNYRPISLTCIICKVFESVIKDQLLAFLESSMTLSRAQHGFLARHSTTSNLLECINDWTARLEKGLNTDVIYVDIARAFDSVSVPKLLYKLSSLGIRDPLLSCIKSFLENRLQRVIVGRSVSTYAPVISGVPQGSVLGPILFILYVNDLPEMCENGDTTKLFADDLKRYSLAAYPNSLQTGLDKLNTWCSDWQLTVAPAKCCCLEINRNYKHDKADNVLPMQSYFLGGQNIPFVNETKDLGVLVDSCLSFSDHIRGVVGKAKQRIYLLFKCFVSRDVSLLLKAYVSYVLPIFDYCSAIWSPYKLTDVDLLENVQRNFTKRLQGMQDLSYEERLSRCGLVSLELRRLRKDLAVCYQIVNGLIAIDFKEFFVACPHTKTRGHRQKLKIPALTHTAARSNFFAVRIVPVWNALPENVILSKSYSVFCKGVQTVDLSTFLKRPWDNSQLLD